MKIKNAILAAVLLAGMPFAVNAQEVENYDDYKVGCESSADCNDFNVDYEQTETNDELSQRTRTRRTRSRRSSFKKIYVTPTLGISILGDGADVGFGGSVSGGYRISEKLAAELEIFDYFGGVEDTDDLGYSYLGLAANGVFRFPFGGDSDSIYGFASPGIGYGRLGLTGDDADDLDDAGFDTSASGFLLQFKAGIGYPVSDSISLIGQAKYSNIFLSDFNGVDDDEDAITFDLGASFSF